MPRGVHVALPLSNRCPTPTAPRVRVNRLLSARAGHFLGRAAIHEPSKSCACSLSSEVDTGPSAPADDESVASDLCLCGDGHPREACPRCEFCGELGGLESPWGRTCDACSARFDAEAQHDDRADDWRGGDL
jgi:hypothetical protein